MTAYRIPIVIACPTASATPAGFNINKIENMNLYKKIIMVGHYLTTIIRSPIKVLYASVGSPDCVNSPYL